MNDNTKMNSQSEYNHVRFPEYDYIQGVQDPVLHSSILCSLIWIIIQ